MAYAILQTHCQQAFPLRKPGLPSFNPIARHLVPRKPSLADFVADKSWLFFHLIDAHMQSLQWLNDNPDTWGQNPDYLHLQSFVEEVKVVNDAAERAVKDVQDYATAHSSQGCCDFCGK